MMHKRKGNDVTDDNNGAAGDNKFLTGADFAVFEQVTREVDIGELGMLTADAYPRVVPVNFVAVGPVIYFHGATRGQKFETFVNSDKVTFSVRLTYSMMPSYWRTEKSACSATQFFKSVLVKGRGRIVADSEEKATALQALMEKCQPEGGFEPITVTDELYRRAIDGVAIFRIDPASITVRSKLGQNLSVAIGEDLIKRLLERADPVDLATAAEIRKTIDAVKEA